MAEAVPGLTVRPSESGSDGAQQNPGYAATSLTRPKPGVIYRTRRVFLRVFVGTLFLALLATFRAGPDFLLLDFLLAALFAELFELPNFVVPALAAEALRRFFTARFRRSGAAATGGTISGSETRPSAASGT